MRKPAPAFSKESRAEVDYLLAPAGRSAIPGSSCWLPSGIRRTL